MLFCTNPFATAVAIGGSYFGYLDHVMSFLVLTYKLGGFIMVARLTSCALKRSIDCFNNC
jgi:hypothetical protein